MKSEEIKDLNIGDYIQLKSDLNHRATYEAGLTYEMVEYQGVISQIDCIVPHHVKLKECGHWNWSMDMIERKLTKLEAVILKEKSSRKEQEYLTR